MKFIRIENYLLNADKLRGIVLDSNFLHINLEGDQEFIIVLDSPELAKKVYMQAFTYLNEG